MASIGTIHGITEDQYKETGSRIAIVDYGSIAAHSNLWHLRKVIH